MLEDGTYEVLVVDAGRSAGTGDQLMTLTLTVVSGPLKGQVVDVVARDLAADEVALLAMPATLVVRNGVPFVHLED